MFVVNLLSHGGSPANKTPRGGGRSPRGAVRLQTGYLYHYAFAMLIGIAGLITWFMFAGGGH